jgi:AcrR family transcriptional regulator
VVAAQAKKPNERGRPRSGISLRPDLSPSDQILDVAAHLFAERGFAATSTRAIADEVGIRQASLYYHFPSKEHLLEALLMRTVEPSMRAARYLATSDQRAAVRLFALVAFDTHELISAPHNVGSLYLLPEIRNDLLSPFRLERHALRSLYADLVADSLAGSVASSRISAGGRDSLDYLVDVVFGMVESVIAIRADRAEPDSELLIKTVAEGCLRVLGHGSVDIADIGVAADALISSMHAALDGE